MNFCFLQGGAKRNSYTGVGIGNRYGFDPNLSDNDVQLKLEEIREHLKKEIRKEMKIKEGAEKLKEATSDKKSISDVHSIVKKTNNKLKELQQELQEINAYLLVSNTSTHHESMAGKSYINVYLLMSNTNTHHESMAGKQSLI